jgi:hypothetical protein
MLGNYFGFFHGVLTDLWISPGFGKGAKLAEKAVAGVVANARKST